MNALLKFVDDTETAPMPWALPIPIEQTAFGTQMEAVEAARAALIQPLNGIGTLGAWVLRPSVSSATTVTKVGVTLSARIVAHDNCYGAFGRADLDTRSSSTGAMYRIARAEAWRFASENLEPMKCVLDSNFTAQYLDICQSSAVHRSLMFDGTNTLADIGIFRPLGSPRVATASALAGYDRYSLPNWDGHGAEPILPETIAATRSLLRILPSTFGEPDVAPAADGTIGLEWVPEAGSLRKLFIDVGPRTIWRAYWKRSNGTHGDAQGVTSLVGVAEIMKSLFDKLSK